jgi:hypothetical protein
MAHPTRVMTLSAAGAIMGDVTLAPALTRPLVGRATELDQLASLIGLDGRPRAGAVLVGGDAGVGKTRLLSELCGRAGEATWRVLVGHCLDFGDSAMPYLPFSEMFGRVAADPDVPWDALVERHPAVRRLLPGRRLLSGSVDTADAMLNPAELLDSTHRVLDELAAEQPVLVVVEDIHWADQSTRDMLSFLFARDFQHPVALVASYRSDDLHRRHPLRAAVAEWGPDAVGLPVDPRAARRRRGAAARPLAAPGAAARGHHARDRAAGRGQRVLRRGAGRGRGGCGRQRSRTTSPTCCWCG